MATCYLRSADGSDGDDGSTWLLAKATLDAAITVAGVGGLIYVDDDHRETQAATKSYAGAGTYAAPLRIIVCTTDTTTPVAAPNSGAGTANFESTSAADDIYFQGVTYLWGVYVKTTQAIGSGNLGGHAYFDNCRPETTETDGWLKIQNDGSSIRVANSTIKVAGVQTYKGGSVVVRNCTLEAAGTATNFINFQSEGGNIILDGNDLSAFAGTNMMDLSQITTANQSSHIEVTNNRLPVGVVINANPPAHNANEHIVKVHGNDNGDNYFQFYEPCVGGDTREDTSVYRTNGATYDGTNEFSLKVTANANASYTMPVRVKVASIDVDATAGATLTLHIAYDNASTLDNSEIALEAKYHDATNQAHGKWEREIALTAITAGDRAAIADVSGSQAWTGTSGFTNENRETIAVTFTGGDGLVDVWFSLMTNACVDGEVYVCPKVEVS